MANAVVVQIVPKRLHSFRDPLPVARVGLMAVAASFALALAACGDNHTAATSESADSSAEQSAQGTESGSESQCNTELVILSGAGGPWWLPQSIARIGGGVSTALVVNGSVYLIDVGDGTWSRYRNFGLGNTALSEGLDSLAGVFITHMHDDHVADLGSLLTLGMANLTPARFQDAPIPILGPGSVAGTARSPGARG